MKTHEQTPDFDEHIEDPLAGDVDRWVHPDETRSDDQIARDEEIANRLHMSGGDGADEYWADYDEYFGTVNGGEDTETGQTGMFEDGTYRLKAEDLVDEGRYVVATEKLSDAELDDLKRETEEAKSRIAAETPGTPEWSAAHTKTVVDIDGNEHRYFDLGPMFKGMSKDEIAAYLRESKQNQQAKEKNQAYWDELDDLEREGETEDPLAGDVDHWVHPDETKGLQFTIR